MKNITGLIKSKRETCRLCESSKLELVVPLVPTPVAEKYLTKEQLNQKEVICPLDIYMCIQVVWCIRLLPIFSIIP